MYKKLLGEKKQALKTAALTSLLFLFLIFTFSWTSYRINPLDILRYLGAQAGSTVGVFLSVPQNPFNTLAQQLKEKEIQLQDRESALEERESVLGEGNLLVSSEIILNLILGIVIILFVLLLLNFYFDYRDRRRLTAREDN